MESFRKDDMRAEAELAKFMDRCFYSKLYDIKQNKPVNFERSKDKESQLHGIDIKLCVGNKVFLIDEKIG